MKILKTILSQLLVIFNMIPLATKKAILIYLLEKVAKSTNNKLDDKLVNKVVEALK